MMKKASNNFLVLFAFQYRSYLMLKCICMKRLMAIPNFVKQYMFVNAIIM